MRALFAYYATTPPPPVVEDATEAETVTDYIAGMTDRFAVRAFAELSVPQGF
jgi:dGTPase